MGALDWFVLTLFDVFIILVLNRFLCETIAAQLLKKLDLLRAASRLDLDHLFIYFFFGFFFLLMLTFLLQLLRLRRPFVAYITDALGNELFRVCIFVSELHNKS